MTDKEIVKKYKDAIKVMYGVLEEQKKKATSRDTINVYNGMMFAKSVFEGTNPEYIDPIIED